MENNTASIDGTGFLLDGSLQLQISGQVQVFESSSGLSANALSSFASGFVTLHGVLSIVPGPQLTLPAPFSVLTFHAAGKFSSTSPNAAIAVNCPAGYKTATQIHPKKFAAIVLHFFNWR